MIRRIVLVMALAMFLFTATACDGGGDDDTPTPTLEPTTAATPEPVATPIVERVVQREPGAAWSPEDAGGLLDAVLLRPEDLPDSVSWVMQTDATTTNADAAQANPASAASNERCGRILGRTIVAQQEDITIAFIAGETLAFFSTATVYGTPEGATDCATETGQQLAAPGQLARAFGPLFIDPDAVQVMAADYPTVGESSFAATLTGQIDAGGSVFDLTLLMVAFRSGNVTAVVGSARSGATPPAEELAPFVDLVLARIEANQ